MKTAIVTGAYDGLGRLIADNLEAHDYTVHRWDIQNQDAPEITIVDVTDWRSVKHAAGRLEIDTQVDVLVNCAGYNRLAKFEDLEPEEFDKHMAVNAYAMVNTAQALLKCLGGGTVCNIISNASHMPMRTSLAYNASKAAAAMITRQMARELGQPHHMTIFGVSPNRLAGTPMSQSVDQQVARVRGWTAEEVRQKQLEALPTGEETDAAVVAEFIGFLLSTKRRHQYLHGAILDYGI